MNALAWTNRPYEKQSDSQTDDGLAVREQLKRSRPRIVRRKTAEQDLLHMGLSQSEVRGTIND